MKRSQHAPISSATVHPSDLGLYSVALLGQVDMITYWKAVERQIKSGRRSVLHPTRTMASFDGVLEGMQFDKLSGVLKAPPAGLSEKDQHTQTAALAGSFVQMLEAADTIYVHEKIAAFMAGSVASIPPDAVLRMDELPCPNGFMWFGAPIEIPCHNPDQHVDLLPADWADRDETLHSRHFHNVRAIHWESMDYGTVKIRVDPTLPPGETRLIVGDPSEYPEPDQTTVASLVVGQHLTIGEIDGALSFGFIDKSNTPAGFEYDRPSMLISLYVDSDPRAHIGGPLTVRNVFVWNEGERVDSPIGVGQMIATRDDQEEAPRLDLGPNGEIPREYPIEKLLPIMFTRQVLLGMSSFMHQQLHAEAVQQPNHLARKRLASTVYEQKPIRVVHLRKRDLRDAGYNPPLEGEQGRRMQGHWLVRRHPRNQWYRSLGPVTDPNAHRLRWIEAYDKGDRSLPLKPSRTLFAVVR